MDLHDHLRVMRKRWRLILAVLLATVGLSAAITLASTPQYESHTEFFVSTSGAQDTGQLIQGNTFTQQRVKSYSQLITTPSVLAPVISKLGLTVSPEELAKAITATVPVDTVLIDVAVADRRPEQAAAIAAAIGEQFPATVADLESLAKSQPSPVKVTVVQTPTVSTVPTSPRPLRNIALGIVLGLALGAGIALLRELLDTRIRDPRDVEALTDAPIIGGIPFDTAAPTHPLLVQADPNAPRAEAFRSLRTNLQFVAASASRSIVVTSSLPGEGKTTTTANLGIILAAAGSRVCLIEGDLRRPKLLDYLGFEGSVGLTDLLIDRHDLGDALQQYRDSTLWLLGSGPIPPNPSELLAGPAMERVLTQLQERFDYVLIDAPPLLPVTDAAILSTRVGGALVVIGSGLVRRDALKHALEALDNVDANTLGLVLNRVPRTGTGSYGYYGYESAPDRAPQSPPHRPAAVRTPRTAPAHTDRQPVPAGSRPRPTSTRR